MTTGMAWSSSLISAALVAASYVVQPVFAHSAFWHPSMYGFNVTAQTFPYDNRPVAPIKNMPFSKWWFHNHLDYPPHPSDVFLLPAGGTTTAEIACNKGATSYFASSEGGDIRNPANPNDVCPGSKSITYHTNGIDDLEGCALGIAYKSEARDVQPGDFTVFSVNQTCVWTRFTEFKVPERMPPCPPGGCVCAFFWIHSPFGGGEENYMNGFKCNVTGSTSTVPLATAKVPRRCGEDKRNNKLFSAPGNCTYGAKQPFYWFNLEGNNMFEGPFSPPVYNDLYNFRDGAQDDIFQDSYVTIPEPAPNAALPVLKDVSTPQTQTQTQSESSSSTSTSSTIGNGGGPITVTITVTASTGALPSATAVSSSSSSSGGASSW
ncbi:hypothetical protein AMATHDRAFT_77284 [Amanita thiersii Skay4041]|uniref:Lytic polysaccharide monooxygenase n=1 Tax=Amanita thiersii Skay4041 TaxID=703135 RepID=A0A2A9NG66_9AGAR|nr:hypothetical protein AMATHDRAFT_77284 [Amanita thiersii Skay4041]